MPLPTPLVTELYQRLCAEPARQEVVEALLRAISAPFEPGETERARVDALLPLIEDPVIGALQGSDQQRVDVTALHRLLLMSRTSEAALSPRGRQLLQQFPRSPGPLAARQAQTSSGQRIGGGLCVGWGGCEVFFLVAAIPKMGLALLIFLSCSVFTQLLPGLLLVRSHHFLNDRRIRIFFSGLITLLLPVMALITLMSMLIGGSKAMLDGVWSMFIPLMVMGIGFRVLLFLLLVSFRRSAG